jgi:hypothetical protein
MFVNDSIGGYIDGGRVSLTNNQEMAANYAMEGTMFDPYLARPFLETNPNHPMRGKLCVYKYNGRKDFTVNGVTKAQPVYRQHTIRSLQERGINGPVWNLVSNATALRKEEWIEYDRVALRAARYRMRAWADLAAANSFGGFNGMAKTVLEYEAVSDAGEAIVDMSPASEVRNDFARFQLRGTPLPITQSGFWLDARKLAISRNSGVPLDTTMGEMCGRRIGEAIEKTTIGIQTGLQFGGNDTFTGGYDITSQVYGYVNYPNRLTKTGLTKPTHSGWTAATTLADVLGCMDTLRAHKFYGPFMVYHSNDWDQYMDTDYILSGGNVATMTLRNRLRDIDGIMDVRRLDFLFASTTDASSGGPGLENLAQAYPFVLVFVQMTPDVARAINGMDITTIQWEAQGGMEVRVKVLAIQVPQLRSDFYGNSGILHATATVS